MTPAAYLDSIIEFLLAEPNITRVQVLRQRATNRDGHVRARLALIDGSLLEFSEYFQVDATDSVHVTTYSYHWMDARGRLIRRWDNTPHHPGIAGFPHHIHEGDNVLPGMAMSIFAVLAAVAESIL